MSPTSPMIWFYINLENYIKLLASSLKMLNFSGFGLIIGQWPSQSFILVIFCFQHVWKSVFFLYMLEQFSLNSLCFGICLLCLSLPAIKFSFYRINLFLVFTNVVFWLLNLLFIWLVMIDLWMQVKLLSFKIADKGILFVDQLVQSFNLLSQHDNFVLEIFYLNFNVSVLVKCLLQVDKFCLVCLNFIIVVS